MAHLNIQQMHRLKICVPCCFWVRPNEFIALVQKRPRMQQPGVICWKSQYIFCVWHSGTQERLLHQNRYWYRFLIVCSCCLSIPILSRGVFNCVLVSPAQRIGQPSQCLCRPRASHTIMRLMRQHQCRRRCRRRKRSTFVHSFLTRMSSCQLQNAIIGPVDVHLIMRSIKVNVHTHTHKSRFYTLFRCLCWCRVH